MNRPAGRKWKLRAALCASRSGIALFLAAAAFTPAFAQDSGIVVRSSTATYAFGQQVFFALEVEAPSAITGVTLFFRPSGSEHTIVETLSVTPGLRVEAYYTHDLRARPFPPFSRISYWWHIEAGNMPALTTPPIEFLYEDNRFDWQVLDQPPLHIHWHQGDLQFGQSAVDTAAAALTRIGRELNSPPPARLDIYIYAESAALQTGLRLAGRDWVGGHADPELGVVLVSVAPGLESRLEMAREIPHELTHVLLYHLVGAGFESLPAWLNEGLASHYEEVPSPEFATALSLAVETDSLIPIQDLCTSFPVQAGEALLAYSESESLVRHIRAQYGIAGITSLVSEYAGGTSCVAGVASALGITFEALENGWRANLGRPAPSPSPMNDLYPYVAVLALVLFAPLVAVITAARRRRPSRARGAAVKIETETRERPLV